MRTGLALAFMALTLLGCDTELCDAISVQARLDAATPGDVVTVGSCRVEGSLRVPAGVVLAGSEGSVLAPGAEGITLVPGDVAAELRALRVEVASGRGIVANGAGSVALTDVDVSVAAGIGLYADGPRALTLSRVRFAGGIDESAGATLPDRATLEEGAAYGLVVVHLGSPLAPVEWTDVEIHDVGPWGGLIATSDVRWVGGEVSGVTGTGLLVEGGALELESVRIADLRRGAQLLSPYGMASVGGARVTTRGVLVEEGEGVGLLHTSGSVEHEALSVRTQARGGIRAQGGASLSVMGDSVFADNALAAIVARDGAISLEDLEVTGTRMSRALVAEAILADVGDGVQLTAVRGTVARLSSTGNARVGLLVDFGAAGFDELSVADVRVGSEGPALGAIAQDETGPIDPGWGGAITREGASVANDPAHAGLLPVVSGSDVVEPVSPLESLRM